jgi:hypothetical protein
VGFLLGDAELAQRELRAGYEFLEAIGERAFARPWRPTLPTRSTASIEG